MDIDILEYKEPTEELTAFEKANQNVNADNNKVNETKNEPAFQALLQKSDKNQTANQIEPNVNTEEDATKRKLIKIYLREFPNETKEYKSKNPDKLTGDELEELKTNVIRSVNTVSSLDTLADNSILVLNAYEYLMADIFPVPGISNSLGNNPAFKSNVKKILLKYMGASLDREMSPELSLLGLIFQSSLMCNTMSSMTKEIQSKPTITKSVKQCEISPKEVNNIPPQLNKANCDDQGLTAFVKANQNEVKAQESFGEEPNFDDL